MMENHVYGQIADNPQAPFINGLMGSANLATNYFAIAHPSSTNYLEVTGGSNFNNLSDQYPDWHDTTCTPNMLSGITNVDVTQSSFPSAVGTVCPIAGSGGTDANIPVQDLTNNEGTPPLTNLNGTVGIPPDTNIVGKTIADELVAAGKSWKSYQEGLPIIGADGVNVSDGYYTIGGNNAEGISVSTDFTTLSTTGNPTSASDIVVSVCGEARPLRLFRLRSGGQKSGAQPDAIVSFDGQQGLYARSQKRATCLTSRSSHRTSATTCMGEATGRRFAISTPTTTARRPASIPTLILQGDLAVERIVTAIKASPVWSSSKSAIVILWDENDYSTITANQVVLIVDTNYGPHQSRAPSSTTTTR